MFVAIFGFFALHQDADPEDCFAKSDNDAIVQSTSAKASGDADDSEENDDLVNVGERFRFCFKLLLALHLFQMVCIVLFRIVRPVLAR